ncbi:axo [Cordylochernes scorpioides]|uniref:Axo n=1 Tax=Cordylochernes scorpioides TaxID=51811 RepID=A0ABY6LUG1_9ARAC|nr:axo [Cordylochernes scorpioides]
MNMCLGHYDSVKVAANIMIVDFQASNSSSGFSQGVIQRHRDRQIRPRSDNRNIYCQCLTRSVLEQDNLELVSPPRYVSGFRGCIHSITLNRDHFDTRHLANVKHSRVTLDNCEFVDPCNNQSVCEHGGVCSVMDGKTVCNCSDTGYLGTTCHFSDHYRSCKDMFMIGYEKNGEYTLDIDKDGPLPPATVYCNMEAGNIFTRVEHNLVNETVRYTHCLSGYTVRSYLHSIISGYQSCRA